MQAKPAPFQLPAMLVVFMGTLVSLWVAVGRALFDKMGSLTVVYVILVAIPVFLLHLFIARNLARVKVAGHVQRRATVNSLVTAWLCLVLFGLTLPDRPRASLETILTSDIEPWTGMAVGIANPLGIIGIALTVAALFLSRTDVLGLKPSEDDLLDAAGY